MSGDVHVQFSERLRVKPPWSTQPYIKVKGNWVYLYRAVDKEGQTIDFMLSEKRDEPAARAFFKKAINSNGLPEKVTMDKSGANKAGVNTINLALALLCMFGGLPLQMTIRQIKYLNNIIEQDHRFVKKITNGMGGVRHFTPLKQLCQELSCIIC